MVVSVNILLLCHLYCAFKKLLDSYRRDIITRINNSVHIIKTINDKLIITAIVMNIDNKNIILHEPFVNIRY